MLMTIYGDSLSMPRAVAHVDVSQMYFEHIKEWYMTTHPGQQVYHYNRSIGGASIDLLWQKFWSDTPYFEGIDPKILIIQSGVVDCSPRPLPHWARAFLSTWPSCLRQPIVDFLHRHRPQLLNAGLCWYRTSRQAYEKVIKTWLTTAAPLYQRIYVVNICPTNEAIEQHSPGFSASISAYNQTIKDVIDAMGLGKIKLIDIHGVIKQQGHIDQMINVKDGHHLTAAGHALIAQLIKEDLCQHL